MKLEPDKKVKIEVITSQCDIMKKGNVVYINGSVLDQKNSSPVCVTALAAIYPWIMGARFGVESHNMGWNEGYRVCCPDKLVDFKITYYK